MQHKENTPYKIFWGDTHHNSYTSAHQHPPIMEVLAFARTHLDFYSGAYYTPASRGIDPIPDRIRVALPGEEGHPSERSPLPAAAWQGIRAERTKDAETIAREWEALQKATAAHHHPGKFVTFPGFEWQGDGTWGDHNVIYKREGHPVHTVPTLPELYARLRGHDALAIPHHIGYHPGIRAPRWKNCDERLSPFAEIYSIHGCSETDEEWMGLRNNSHMGPGIAGGTYQDALDSGLHLGAIGSTDNWKNMPGCWNQGLMACLATELTRESLWDAFQNRRVYGVTGDRIELTFTCNGEPMGSILKPTPERVLRVNVRGQDAIDRIEILRNGRVMATHCHQGHWNTPADGATTRFKLRIETGWGPRLGELPFLKHDWNGRASLSQGQFTAWSPCWIARDQRTPEFNGSEASFALSSHQVDVTKASQGAVVLEFESEPEATMTVRLNGKTIQDRLRSWMQGSRAIWYRDECLAMLREFTGITPQALERQDPLFYHYAFKAKFHRVIPEAGYCASFSITDGDTLPGSTHYRVRVEQRNGQRAWSSPIWIASSDGEGKN